MGIEYSLKNLKVLGLKFKLLSLSNWFHHCNEVLNKITSLGCWLSQCDNLALCLLHFLSKKLLGKRLHFAPLQSCFSLFTRIINFNFKNNWGHHHCWWFISVLWMFYECTLSFLWMWAQWFSVWVCSACALSVLSQHCCCAL